MTEIHDLVAPYALDALDSEESSRFESHLVTCTRCQEELVGLRVGVTELAEAVAVQPPPHLKETVMAATVDASNVVVELEPRRSPRLAWSLVAVAAAIAVVFFGLWTVTNTRLSSAQQIAAIYEAPDATVIELDGSHGPARLVFSPSLGEGVFNGSRLADIDDSDIYEMWLIDSEGAVAAGTLQPGEAAVLVDGISPGTTFAVTVEEAPGVEQSTNEPVLVVEI